MEHIPDPFRQKSISPRNPRFLKGVADLYEGTERVQCVWMDCIKPSVVRVPPTCPVESGKCVSLNVYRGYPIQVCTGVQVYPFVQTRRLGKDQTMTHV